MTVSQMEIIFLLSLMAIKPGATSRAPVTSPRPMGCYQYSMKDTMALREGEYTFDECLERCAGFKYSGVATGNKCFCSNQPLTKYSLAVNRCDVRCVHYQGVTCGGRGAMSLYAVPVKRSGRFVRLTRPVDASLEEKLEVSSRLVCAGLCLQRHSCYTWYTNASGDGKISCVLNLYDGKQRRPAEDNEYLKETTFQ